LRADDPAGAPGAGDDDRRIRIRHQVGEPQHQLGARAGDRPRHMKARVFVERAAVEDDDVLAGPPPPVELGGRHRRRPVIMLDDLGEGLARHVGAGKQRMAGRRPGIDPACEDMDRAIAQRHEPARRLVGDAVAVIDQHHRAGMPRHQLPDDQFEAAVRHTDREQRMPGAVLPLFADIEKRHFIAPAEPLSDGRDIDSIGHGGHGVALPFRVAVISPRRHGDHGEKIFSAKGAEDTQRPRRRSGPIATIAYPLRPLR